MTKIEVPDAPPAPLENQPDVNRRCCATCACCITQTDKTNVAAKAYFCLKNPPFHRDVRARVPAPDGKGNFIEGVQRHIELHPCDPNGVCFDGWRPAGTLPGANWQMEAYLAQMMPLIESLIGKPASTN